MKIALSLVLTIIVLAAIVIKPLWRFRWKIMAGYAFAMIILFTFYNYRTINLIIPIYHPLNQMFYQSEFAEEGEYPDALLAYILQDRNVVLPAYAAWDDSNIDSEEAWKDGNILCMNIENILKESGANVYYSDMKYVIEESEKEYFEDFGYLNDTLRYSYLYNNLETEYGNGFFYYWFYGASTQPMKLYVCTNNMDEDDTLYLLFDGGFNFYLVSSQFYEEEVRKS